MNNNQLSLTEKEAKIENKIPARIKLEMIVTDTFKLHCFETMTGMKFIVIADPTVSQQEAKTFLKSLYEAFADYVIKDPFFVVKNHLCEIIFLA